MVSISGQDLVSPGPGQGDLDASCTNRIRYKQDVEPVASWPIDVGQVVVHEGLHVRIRTQNMVRVSVSLSYPCGAGAFAWRPQEVKCETVQFPASLGSRPGNRRGVHTLGQHKAQRHVSHQVQINRLYKRIYHVPPGRLPPLPSIKWYLRSRDLMAVSVELTHFAGDQPLDSRNPRPVGRKAPPRFKDRLGAVLRCGIAEMLGKGHGLGRERHFSGPTPNIEGLHPERVNCQPHATVEPIKDTDGEHTPQLAEASRP